jgi:hypothetical protein
MTHLQTFFSLISLNMIRLIHIRRSELSITMWKSRGYLTAVAF